MTRKTTAMVWRRQSASGDDGGGGIDARYTTFPFFTSFLLLFLLLYLFFFIHLGLGDGGKGRVGGRSIGDKEVVCWQRTIFFLQRVGFWIGRPEEFLWQRLRGWCRLWWKRKIEFGWAVAQGFSGFEFGFVWVRRVLAIGLVGSWFVMGLGIGGADGREGWVG
eukprot:TRINITY_DN41922_c0_g2_i3.p1 TRINITY_DN41922_c0_g2~~TRINITY_DN41922_c0_g2_i3.p1  ORF type:complete len:163 (+),score=22.18 TRINITY_DN41922_c0_g2_i3:64-552(+)